MKTDLFFASIITIKNLVSKSLEHKHIRKIHNAKKKSTYYFAQSKDYQGLIIEL